MLGLPGSGDAAGKEAVRTQALHTTMAKLTQFGRTVFGLKWLFILIMLLEY